MKNTAIYIVVLGLVWLLSSCEKESYKNDGGPSDAFVNMTTYDFLKSHPKFDSLVRIIDHAGMKDVINGNVTFFVTTNYGIADYVSAKKQQKIIELGNENISFSINDIPAEELRDSLKIYLYDGHINRSNMTTDHDYYTSLAGPIDNVRFRIRLRRTRDFSAYLDYVDYVNFTKVVGSLDEEEPDINAIPDELIDRSVDCQTSGIMTTNGVIHVLQGSHRLFFNAQPMAQ